MVNGEYNNGIRYCSDDTAVLSEGTNLQTLFYKNKAEQYTKKKYLVH